MSETEPQFKGPAIAVVVPVHNGAAFLQQCLASLAAQTFGDFACFVVDDGSTDGTAALLDALAAEGKKGGWIILGGKGSTEFGIGASAAEVVRAIFYNENRVLSVSVLLDGKYGQHDVYASVPAIVGRDGIAEIIELHLTPEEQEKFNASCKTMSENYQLSLTL